MTITCAIIDDEPLAAGLLESYAKKTPYLDLQGIYNSAILAMKDLRENPVQLLFLERSGVCKDPAQGDQGDLYNSLLSICY